MSTWNDLKILGVHIEDKLSVKDRLSAILESLYHDWSSETFYLPVSGKTCIWKIYRRYYQSLILLFECIKRNGAVYISNLLEPRQLRYDLRSSEHNLIQPSYTNPSHTYKASHLCNQQNHTKITPTANYILGDYFSGSSFLSVSIDQRACRLPSNLILWQVQNNDTLLAGRSECKTFFLWTEGEAEKDGKPT